MQQQLIQEHAFFGTGASIQANGNVDVSNGDSHAAARALYNLPSPSEKLTDSTLPIAWPAPYLDQLKREGAVALSEAAPASQEQAPVNPMPEDYAQLMRKLQAESLVARQGSHVDKALYVAHYASTMIAALAFIAMMGVLILTSFPSLLPL